MTTSAAGLFDDDAAVGFLSDLRSATPTTVGDAVSGALRAVAQAEAPLPVADVQRALVAIALLLCVAHPELLDGLDDADGVRHWFDDLEIELNPARRQIAAGALDRILLPADNAWYDHRSASGDGGAAALATVHRLHDLLADFGAGD